MRAKRRYEDLLSRGEQVTLDEVLEKQRQRDARDLDREIGGLRMAKDSVVVRTDGMTADEVVEKLGSLANSRGNSEIEAICPDFRLVGDS